MKPLDILLKLGGNVVFLEVIGLRFHSSEHDCKKLASMLAEHDALLPVPFEVLTRARSKSALGGEWYWKVLRIKVIHP